MFNSDVQKLIQEIKSIQTESSLLGKPVTDNTLFLALQKCMIHHPVYKETVATVHQLNFDTLATVLGTCQLALKNIPAQKIDPCQANTRTTSSKDQNKSAKEADTDNNSANTKVANKVQKICCWICKQTGHGAKQCDASVTIPKNSSLTSPN